MVAEGMRRHLPAIVVYLKSWYFIGSVACLLAAFVAMMAARVDLQWFWMLLFAASTIPFAPWVADPVRFFRGGVISDGQDGTSWFVLSAAAFVSWIFAKGILNTSTLGASFGVVGGLAYASWYAQDSRALPLKVNS
jgi:hypothetical protein